MAMVIPIHNPKKGRGRCALLVILSQVNLERMRTGDPFDIALRALDTGGDGYLNHPLSDLDLIVAYEDDEQTIVRIAKEGGLPAVLAYVERNRVHREGDLEPPVSVKPHKVEPQ
jgi:hypothetical protein